MYRRLFNRPLAMAGLIGSTWAAPATAADAKTTMMGLRVPDSVGSDVGSTVRRRCNPESILGPWLSIS